MSENRKEIAELRRRLHAAEAKAARLAEIEDREAHFKQVLLAIRNVNQLIVAEDDPRRLIERACVNLTETLGYLNAWIALLDTGNGQRVGFVGKPSIVATAASGFDGGFEPLAERLAQGRFPHCMEQAFQCNEAVVIKDPNVNCPGCPVSGDYSGRAGLCRALVQDGTIYGILVVSVPVAYAHDAEEKDLFEEVTGDLAFALHKIAIAQKLADSERRYREIFEGSRDGFVMVDTTGHILDVNRAYCEMLGYSIDELRALPDFYAITPERWHAWEATEIWEKRLLDQGYSGVYEKEYIRKDGTIFPVELRAYAVRREDGTVAYLWASARDISDRKSTEEALVVASRRMAEAVRAANVGLWEWDLATNRVWYSAEWKWQVGCEEDDIEDRFEEWETRVHPDDLEPTLYRVRQAITDGDRNYHTEFRFRHKDDSYRWILAQASVYRDEAGRPLRALGSHIDITERRRAEAVQAEQKALLEAIYRNAPLVMMVVNADHRVLQVNGFALQFAHRTADEMLGMRGGEALRCLHALDHPEGCGFGEVCRQCVIRNTVLDTVEHGTTHLRVEASYSLSLDGAARDATLLVSTTPITVHDARMVLVTMQDISELKQKEIELARSKAQLERTNRELEQSVAHANQLTVAAEAATMAKSEFLANMSHEIRTPMTAILGFAKAAQDGCPSQCDFAQTTYREYLDTITRNGEYLLQLLNDILDLSKIEAGRLAVERIDCSPCRLVMDVYSLVHIRAEEKGLEMRVQFEGNVPETIQTDPTRLRQILINLLGNAVKFTESGSVTLMVRLADRLAEGPALAFDVVDTGLGMTSAEAAGLFEPFSQADTSTTRRFGGTGLGLAVSKRLAEALGGDIQLVETQPDVGSRFRLMIATGPLDGVCMLDESARAEQLKLASRPEPAQQADLTDCRVLLAEDGVDNQRLITHLLKRAGAQTALAENGRLAVEAALAARDAGQPFDVILMDMQMPEMDGYEATGLLRQRGYAGPIIALTAHAMEGDRRKCLEAGCDDYMSKPMTREGLLGTVARHLKTP